MVRFRYAAALALLALTVIGIAPPAGAVPVTVAGGDVLTSGSGRCTLGFNVTGRAVLAGRCGPVGTAWSKGATPVGVVSTVFAGTGLTLVSITNPDVVQVHGLRNGAAISSAARATVGRVVSELSPVSGLHSGTVTAVNATVNLGTGVITGLDRSTLCPDAGGTGSPVFAGTIAMGLVVGGSGNCTSGGTTYSQPVVPLLTQTGRAIF